MDMWGGQTHVDYLVQYLRSEDNGKHLKFYCVYDFMSNTQMPCLLGHELSYEKDFLNAEFKVRNARPAEITLYGKKHT